LTTLAEREQAAKDRLKAYYWDGVSLQPKICRACHYMPSGWPEVGECAHGRSIHDPDRMTDCEAFEEGKP